MPGTIKLHRVLRSPPALIYKAFTNAEALARWLPPNGYTATVHEMDARVGGKFKMSFTHFASGNSHSFGGEYLELMPGKLLRYTDVFDDPGLSGEMTVTVSLKEVSVGTEIDITQQGIPDVIPEEACYLGWQDSLLHLARLVEAEVFE